jgi:type II secretory pathway component PulK
MKTCMRGRQNRGFILEVVLLGAAVVFILAASMLEVGAMGVRASATRYRQTQAFYCAEAGVQRVLADLLQGAESSWISEEQSLADAFYRVQMDSGEDGTARVVSTGEFRRPNGERIAVVLQAVFEPSPENGGYKTVSWEYLR